MHRNLWTREYYFKTGVLICTYTINRGLSLGVNRGPTANVCPKAPQQVALPMHAFDDRSKAYLTIKK